VQGAPVLRLWVCRHDAWSLIVQQPQHTAATAGAGRCGVGGDDVVCPKRTLVMTCCASQQHSGSNGNSSNHSVR
jgi:hypothetical protein